MLVKNIRNGDQVAIVNWRDPDYRIETIVLADGTFSYNQIVSIIYDSPNFLGDYTVAETAYYGFLPLGTSGNDLAEFINHALYFESLGPPLPESPIPVLDTVDQDAALRIMETYIAYFNRAPEHSGLNYWLETYQQQTASGVSADAAISEISNAFYDTSVAYFSDVSGFTADMPDIDFVATIYANVLGRPDARQNDPEGINYWLTQFDPDNRAALVTDIIDTAKAVIANAPNDPVSIYVDNYLNNRLIVSTYFAEQGVSEKLTGDQAIQAGIEALVNITDDFSSVEATIDFLQQQYGDPLII
ncbi:hemolysin-type calcium binding protein related domain protein [Methylophaga frappieri]|uniref:Hemolysin-type calcium binding protein related domain protein n=1 Tax=Methylophaga frappieri (strain ATCC BAA-2434 / DSM 25690 / JAM7) TaxID=754477 RepID=I1YKK9_METFJ|nr:calcium-binding protein [Methylophaga frappieri]AFJ03452.1 hemolysin-type calcium binding protein related domain protein [Methylophaga frappieri]